MVAVSDRGVDVAHERQVTVQDMREMENRLESRIYTVRDQLRKQIAEFKEEVSAKFDAVDAKFDAVFDALEEIKSRLPESD